MYWNSARNETVVNCLTEVETTFGTSAPDTAFIGYWDDRATALGLSPTKDIRASFFVRPDRGALVYLTNLGRQAQAVAIKPNLSAWKVDAVTAVDAEIRQPDGRVVDMSSITIEPRDFRVLLLNKAGK